jgi:hypothetical protein
MSEVIEHEGNELMSLDSGCLALNTKPTREQLFTLQRFLMQFPAVDMELRHNFAPGMYVRELEIPEDVVVVGKTHKHHHIVMLTEGACRINTDKGMEDIIAPHTWHSYPGDKRALYTYEHCTFVTIHTNPDNNEDIASLEDSLVDHDYIALEGEA